MQQMKMLEFRKLPRISNKSSESPETESKGQKLTIEIPTSAVDKKVAGSRVWQPTICVGTFYRRLALWDKVPDHLIWN
ncbi:hypothetical protein EUTSA_v10015890mg [Eutrema salsugineum]|uniref:Uncharacterized protein n=1 Tax=Eutrema salsugineum TaxID=72664 RepID=V4LF30_EUTSA|nr:hypothetical protein EUTSA_v10015890mg [Eutrema salsugineum]